MDRVLKNNGNLFVLDFDPSFAYKNEYGHREGMFSYKMKYVNMFIWNPAYTQIYHESFSHDGAGYSNNPDEKSPWMCFVKTWTMLIPLALIEDNLLSYFHKTISKGFYDG